MLLALPFPAIDPVLIEVGPFALRWYALAYVAGIVLGWWYAVRLVREARLWPGGTPPLSSADLDDFVLWATLGIIIGGRIGYVLFYNLSFFLENPAEIPAVWHGGMSFHGGAAGVAAAIVLFAKRRGIPVLSQLDLMSAVAPIGLFFGRIANFVNAELFGRETDVPWGVVFPNGGPLPRHPSQLYEAALEGIVLFLVLRLLTHRFGAFRRPGFVFGAFLAGYGAARAFVELFRMPDAQVGFLYGGLTMGMVLSLPMVAVGAGFMLAARRPAPDAAA